MWPNIRQDEILAKNTAIRATMPCDFNRARVTWPLQVVVRSWYPVSLGRQIDQEITTERLREIAHGLPDPQMFLYELIAKVHLSFAWRAGSSISLTKKIPPTK